MEKSDTDHLYLHLGLWVNGENLFQIRKSKLRVL
jgi:hypothetical protein